MRADRSSFAHTPTWLLSLLPIATAVGLMAIALLGLLAHPVVAGSTTGASLPPAPVEAPSDLAPAVAAPTTIDVAGSVVAVRDGLLGVQERDGVAPVGFSLDGQARVVRDGRLAAAADLQPGDQVRLSVDGGTGRVLAVDAEPTAAAPARRLPTPSGVVAGLAGLGLIAAGALLVARLRLARAAHPVVRRPAPSRPRAVPAARQIRLADRGDLATPAQRHRPAA